MLFIILALACKEPLPTTSNSVADPSTSNKGCKITTFWKDLIAGKPTVSISGTIQYDGEIEGDILLDLTSVQKNQTVVGYQCSSSGEFSVLAPADLGTVWGLAFIDNQGGGKSKDDPHGRSSEFVIAKADITDIKIKLTTETVVKEVFNVAPPLDAAPVLDPQQKRVPDPGETNPDESQ